jgi:hypothetical protein
MYHIRDPITGRHSGNIIHYNDSPRNSQRPRTRTLYIDPNDKPDPNNFYVYRSPSPVPRSDYGNAYPTRVNNPRMVHPMIQRQINPEPVFIEQGPPAQVYEKPVTHVLNENPPSYHSDTISGVSQQKLRVASDNANDAKYRQWKQQQLTTERARQRTVTVYPDTRSASRRKCLTILLGILAVLLLAGLIVGLYFGITEALKQQSRSAPTNNVRGGYSGGQYVNGVYVVPVTSNPGYTYLIYGTDVPCNPYNNNTVTIQPNYPNCNQVTTRIVLADWTTTTVRAVYLSGGARESSSLALIAVGMICMTLIGEENGF